MRLAIVSTWDVRCGIATYTRALRESLLSQGIECDVVPIDRTEVKYLARRELRPYFAGLADSLQGYDLVHVQHEHGIFGGSHSIPVAVGVTRRFLSLVAAGGTPVAVTFHTGPVDAFGMGSAWAAALGAGQRAHWRAALGLTFRRHANLAAIVHTRASRRALVDWGMPADSISVIPHGIDVPYAPPPTDDERRAARVRLGFPEDATVLCQFGFLAEYKGIATSVRALHYLPERFHLAVIGDTHPHGGDAALERALAALEEPGPEGGVMPASRERAHLVGWLAPERFGDWHAATSIALAPYHDVPGFSASGALNWSLAAGVPVIASRIPPFVELDERSGCLSLVAPDAARELAHRALQLEGDPDRGRELAAAARAYAEEVSWARVAELHRALYERVLADQPAAARTSGSTSSRSAPSASTTNGSSSSHPGASSRSASASSRR